jgi:hypothetical protein
MFGFELISKNMFEMKILKITHFKYLIIFQNDSLSKC